MRNETINELRELIAGHIGNVSTNLNEKYDLLQNRVAQLASKNN